MKKLFSALCVTTTAVLGLAAPAPASAAPTGDTIVTFTVATADLNIVVPASVNLGSVLPGESLTGRLGPVRVIDERAALNATWTVTVTATSFTSGSGSAAETIPPNLVEYWSGPTTASTGTGTLVPGQPTAADAVTLSVPRVVFSKTTGAGANSATWNPTLEIAVPADAVGGTYTGTVTHSVA